MREDQPLLGLVDEVVRRQIGLVFGRLVKHGRDADRLGRVAAAAQLQLADQRLNRFAGVEHIIDNQQRIVRFQRVDQIVDIGVVQPSFFQRLALFLCLAFGD